MTTRHYPLSWPRGWKRTPADDRQSPRWHQRRTRTRVWTDGTTTAWSQKDDLSIADATDRLRQEIGRLNVADGDWLLSTNLELRLDGFPRSAQRAPTDPGAAVYFRLRGHARCLACDRYTTVAGNIAALAAHIEAMRAIERYGVGTLDQAFAGYTALPEKADGRDWHAEFGFGPLRPHEITVDIINARYRELARQRHPDSGGSHAAMARLNAARRAALEEIG